MSSSAQMAASSRRRRRVIPIIDARFQWKYTLLIVALGVGVSFVMGGLLYRAHLDNTRLLDLDQRLQEQVIRGDQIFLLYLIIGIVLMAAVLGVWGLIVTHRISGPLFIVARYLDVLADGQYPDVRPLRKRDELQEFFATFEDAVNGLRGRDIENMRVIDAALADGDNHDGAIKALEQMREALQLSLGGDQGIEVE